MFLQLTVGKLPKVICILYTKVRWHFCNNKIHPPVFTKTPLLLY